MVMRKPTDFSTNPSPAAIAYANQFLKYKSILRQAELMQASRVDGIVKHVIEQLMWMAVNESGEQQWVARALNADDMPGGTTRQWLETTGTTSDGFVAAALGDGTALADDTYIGIYGAQFKATAPRDFTMPATLASTRPPVTAVRFIVGGTRVAEWDLYSIWNATSHVGPNSTATEKLGSGLTYPIGIAESPVLIGKQKNLLVEFYEEVATTATTFVLQFLGIVVEKRAGGLASLSP